MKALYYHFKKHFTELECEELKSYALQFEQKTATVGYGGANRVDEDQRTGKVVWLKKSDRALAGLFARLTLCALEANLHCFELDLLHEPRLCYENAQFTQYTSESSDHFDWHQDEPFVGGRSPARKLSLVVQLTDRNSYSGAEFEFEDCKLQPDHFVDIGDVIVFPSFLKHRVKPILSGTRHSLVIWYQGPKLS